jgi:hypothetical protein
MGAAEKGPLIKVGDKLDLYETLGKFWSLISICLCLDPVQKLHYRWLSSRDKLTKTDSRILNSFI